MNTAKGKFYFEHYRNEANEKVLVALACCFVNKPLLSPKMKYFDDSIYKAKILNQKRLMRIFKKEFPLSEYPKFSYSLPRSFNQPGCSEYVTKDGLSYTALLESRNVIIRNQESANQPAPKTEYDLFGYPRVVYISQNKNSIPFKNHLKPTAFGPTEAAVFPNVPRGFNKRYVLRNTEKWVEPNAYVNTTKYAEHSFLEKRKVLNSSPPQIYLVHSLNKKQTVVPYSLNEIEAMAVMKFTQKSIPKINLEEKKII